MIIRLVEIVTEPLWIPKQGSNAITSFHFQFISSSNNYTYYNVEVEILNIGDLLSLTWGSMTIGDLTRVGIGVLNNNNNRKYY